MVRIRAGWGINCAESFDGAMLVRSYVDIDTDPEERLDSVFEYDPLISWLNYIDGEVEIETGSGITFVCGNSRLEKQQYTTLGFPPLKAGESAENVTITADDWQFLQTQLGKADDSYKSVDLFAIHHAHNIDGSSYIGTTFGHGMAICRVESTISSAIAISASGILAAFSALGKPDRICVEKNENGFYCGEGDTEVFFPNSAHPNILDGTIETFVRMDQPFFSIKASQISDAVSAIRRAYKSNFVIRGKFFTDDGWLYLVGGDMLDFYSLPIEKVDFEIGENLLIMANMALIDNAINTIENAEFWFVSDPRAGPTKFKVVGGNKQSIIIPMK